MKKSWKKSFAVAAVSIPLMSGAALAGEVGAKKQQADSKMDSVDARKTATATPSKGKMSCGQHMAAQAPMMEKRAALMTQVADTYAAHAEWLGTAPEAKEERAALLKAAAAMRDVAKKVKTMARQMEMNKDLKESPHDMKNTAAINKVAEMELKTAQLQLEVSKDLETSATEMQAAAQQMQMMTGTGGSGAIQPDPMQQPEDEQEQNAWPPMPESRQP